MDIKAGVIFSCGIFPCLQQKTQTNVTLEGLFMECQNSKIKRILYILLFLCVQEKTPRGNLHTWRGVDSA